MVLFNVCEVGTVTCVCGINIMAMQTNMTSIAWSKTQVLLERSQRDIIESRNHDRYGLEFISLIVT